MLHLGKVIPTGVVLLSLLIFPLLTTAGNAIPSDSAYAEAIARRLGVDFRFTCPEEISTGSTDSVELTIKTGVSTAELARLIREISPRSGDAEPYLVAELDFIKTDGLISKSMTPERQKVIAYGQNRWSWQLKGLEPGEHLLSLTISLGASDTSGGAIATPIAINREIRVVGEAVPVPDTGSRATLLIVGILLILGGVLGKVIQLARGKIRDRSFQVLPGGEQKVFVSYSKHDRKRVLPVIEHLKASGHQIWIDRHGIEGAASWREEIVEALTHSKYLLFFASKRSYRSINVGKELCLAADENLVIIPVLLEDCKPDGAGKFIVAGLQRIDARDRSPRETASDLSVLLNKNISNFFRDRTGENPVKPTPEPV
ncbi:MAG: toll/interleukin-1 receptor domain-containing protein [Verrucomicrobiales bacterium]|nr:toll/interleukin-1 receptor domain-containing protein [Verrucomicrobiales bacterium]